MKTKEAVWRGPRVKKKKKGEYEENNKRVFVCGKEVDRKKERKVGKKTCISTVR